MKMSTKFMKNLPIILTIAGCVGVAATAYFAAKVTPEASRRMKRLKKEKEQEVWDECTEIAKSKLEDGDEPTDPQIAEEYNLVKKKDLLPSPKDVVKEIIPLYIPAFLMGTASIACVIAANTIHIKRLTATSAALTATEEAFRTYRDNVVKQIGEKKASEVLERVYKESTDKKPIKSEEHPEGTQVVISEAGGTLCFDQWGGHYFKMSIGKLKSIITEMNVRLSREDWISLNDLYYELGIPRSKMGDDLGWDIMRGKLDPHYTSILGVDENGQETPIFVLDWVYGPAPRYKYGDGVY